MQLDYLLLTLVALTIFLSASQLAVLFLFTRILKDLRGDHTKNEEFTAEAKKKSLEIIEKTASDAAKIISEARESALKHLSDEKLSTKDFAEKFDQGIKTVEESFKGQMQQNIERAEKSFSTLLVEYQKSIDSHMQANEANFNQKTDSMLEKTQALLDKFTAEIQQKIQGQVEAEIEAARKEIAEYRSRRMAIVDDRIIDIIESVMQVVLAKKMSVADQSDLVYKSLDEAKAEHAFGK